MISFCEAICEDKTLIFFSSSTSSSSVSSSSFSSFFPPFSWSSFRPKGQCGHSSGGRWRKGGPSWNNFHPFSSSAFIPLEAGSAGLRGPGTNRHWSLEVSARIFDTLFLTKVSSLRDELTICLITVDESVQKTNSWMGVSKASLTVRARLRDLQAPSSSARGMDPWRQLVLSLLVTT